MIGILDVEAAHIYWCDTDAEAQCVRQMLDLMGKNYKEVPHG